VKKKVQRPLWHRSCRQRAFSLSLLSALLISPETRLSQFSQGLRFFADEGQVGFVERD
jgi:hypothetical protein